MVDDVDEVDEVDEVEVVADCALFESLPFTTYVTLIVFGEVVD